MHFLGHAFGFLEVVGCLFLFLIFILAIGVLETISSTASAMWNPCQDSTQFSGTPKGYKSEYHVSRHKQTDMNSTLVNSSNNSSILRTLSVGYWVPPANVNADMKKSETVTSCRLFGFDLKAPSAGAIVDDKANVNPVHENAEGHFPSSHSAGDSDQKSDLSKDNITKERQQGQLQVSPKEVQSKQSCSTRTRTKVYGNSKS